MAEALPTRPLGPGGPAVTAVSYGGMHLSIQDRPPEEQSLRVLRAVMDAGATLIDTADAYCLDESEIGHNERLVGRALNARGGSGGAGGRVYVATKGGILRTAGRWEQDGRPEHLRRACDRSLRALGVERIDLYQLHAPDPKVPFLESVGALAQLRQEGKVERVGLSNVSVDQIRAAESMLPVATVQNRLNPFFREALSDGVLRYCTERGIGFLAYSPTGGGRLNRKLPAHPVLSGIAARLGISTHVVTLAWVLAQSPVTIVIPSARRVEHALDSLRAAEVTLAPEDLEAIDRAEFSRA